MNASTLSARALVGSLLLAGVRDVVVSPGSRSAPLVYAWADAEAALASSAHPLTVHVRIDERDAAFTALGIAKAGRLQGRHRPVAVVTTSGSAVGNLHPAVMEAAHQHLPLILVTADRPARLRRTGANQTLDAQHTSLPEVVAAWDLPVPTAHSAEALAGSSAVALTGCSAEVPAGSSGEAPTEGTASVQDWADAAEAAVARACSSPPGPVQVNAQFDAPLVPAADAGVFAPALADSATVGDDGKPTGDTGDQPGGGGESAVDHPADSSVVWARVGSILEDPDARPVIVAGDDLGFSTATLRGLAESTATPILAEPSSALSSSPRTIPAHAQLLGAEASTGLRERITHVIVSGRPTLSRPIARLLDREDIERLDLPYDADGLVGGSTGRSDSDTQSDWWDAWHALDEEREAAAPGASTSSVDAAVLALLEEPGVLVAASSNTVRLLAHLQRPHHPARVVASRGLAGIDGLVATASGVALGLAQGRAAGAAEPTTPVRLLIGDLAALHDLGGFVIPAHEQRPHLQIVVLNDDGGAIFAGLEHSQPHVAARFDRFFATPHGLDLAAAAQALGMDAESVDASAPDVPGRVRAFLTSGEPGLLQLRLPPVRG